MLASRKLPGYQRQDGSDGISFLRGGVPTNFSRLLQFDGEQRGTPCVLLGELASTGRMEDGTRKDLSLAADAAGADGEEGSVGVGVDPDASYRRLIQDQMAELEELKRAAREASPSR